MSGDGPGWFVTGTDTGIGKTVVAAGMLRLLRDNATAAAGMKPVASGCRRTGVGLRNDDAELLRAESAQDLPYEVVNPLAFEPAIAPHLAAREAGEEIRIPWLRERFAALRAQAGMVVVEGVGGWRVPLGADGDIADLARALALPVIVVVGMRLGCISHALLTAESVERAGLPLAGWVANALPPEMPRLEANIATLRDRMPAPLLGTVPVLSPPTPAAVAGWLQWPLPGVT